MFLFLLEKIILLLEGNIKHVGHYQSQLPTQHQGRCQRAEKPSIQQPTDRIQEMQNQNLPGYWIHWAFGDKRDVLPGTLKDICHRCTSRRPEACLAPSHAWRIQMKSQGRASWHLWIREPLPIREPWFSPLVQKILCIAVEQYCVPQHETCGILGPKTQPAEICVCRTHGVCMNPRKYNEDLLHHSLEGRPTLMTWKPTIERPEPYMDSKNKRKRKTQSENNRDMV